MQSGFQTALEVDLKAGCDSIWIVHSPLLYYSELLELLVTVPTLFETDFASVPRVPFAYAAWGDRAHREATLHDWLYCYDSNPIVPENIANAVFLEAMKSTDKDNWIAYGMYYGVCLGGKKFFHKRSVFAQLQDEK